jgi:hypothetical protein
VVTRYSIDTASTTLWLNPAAESDPGITASDLQSAATIASYGFRQDTDVGATIMVDDLKVGLSFAAVVATGNGSGPNALTLKLHTSQIVLSWTNSAFTLQAGPAPGGPFTNVPGSISPYTNAITGSQRFFRLKH